jgi:hypothetical protein
MNKKYFKFFFKKVLREKKKGVLLHPQSKPMRQDCESSLKAMSQTVV